MLPVCTMRRRWTRSSVSGASKRRRRGRSPPSTGSSRPQSSGRNARLRMRSARCTTSCTPKSWSSTTTSTPAASICRTAASKTLRTWCRSRAMRWLSCAPRTSTTSRRGTSAGPIATTTVSLHGSAGWSVLGSVSGAVPAAPEQRELLALPVAVGTYNGVRLGTGEQPVAIVVIAGQVEPLLLGLEGGHLISGAAYAGNDQVNLGLGELAGKFVAMPAFDLIDQAGNRFDNATIAGKDVVVAAFNTTCHQTCQ